MSGPTCRWCKKAVSKHRYYCDRVCRRKFYRLRNKLDNAPPRPQAHDGRQCVFCAAYDHETCFPHSLLRLCAACERARARCGICDTCGQPKTRQFAIDGTTCHSCTPPFGCLRIVLVERAGHRREKVIYRRVLNGHVTINRVRHLIKRVPLSIVVGSGTWVRIRV